MQIWLPKETTRAAINLLAKQEDLMVQPSIQHHAIQIGLTHPVQAVPNNEAMFHCILCIKVHYGWDIHKTHVEKMKHQATLKTFITKLGESSLEKKKTLKAELMAAQLANCHNPSSRSFIQGNLS